MFSHPNKPGPVRATTLEFYPEAKLDIAVAERGIRFSKERSVRHISIHLTWVNTIEQVEDFRPKLERRALMPDKPWNVGTLHH